MRQAILVGRIRTWALGLAVVALSATGARACPFCSAVTQTLGEELRGSDVGVLARMVNPPADAAAATDPAAAASLDGKPSEFEIIEVLKGGELLGEHRRIEVVYFGQATPGQLFFIMGSDPAQLAWATPIALSEEATTYVRALPGLPESGPERLAFFQQHLEHAEPMLAQDAYDEFAKAPYADVKAFRDRMDREQIRAKIGDKDVPASRRRLYLTMLGVCGDATDVPVLEAMIRAKEPELRSTLDAMVAAYLTLHGPEGIPLVEELFFRDPAADFTDTYSALVALRFHGQEEKIIPRERLLVAFRLMLDRPQYADLVIPDLARWEDWEALPRLVQLFREADEQSSWVRTPVIQFLRVCPLPEAQAQIAELEKIDPEAVKRANSFLPFNAATVPVPPPSDSAAVPASDGTPATDGTAAIDPVPTAVEATPMPPTETPPPSPPATQTTEAAEPALPPAPVENFALPGPAGAPTAAATAPGAAESPSTGDHDLAASAPGAPPPTGEETAATPAADGSAAESVATVAAATVAAATTSTEPGTGPSAGPPVAPGSAATVAPSGSTLLAIAAGVALVIVVVLLALVYAGGGRKAA